MTEYMKPIPEVSENAREYWNGCKAHRLLLPKCRACGTVFFFPNKFCPDCLSEDIEWIEAEGKGTVHTFSIVYRPPGPAFAPDVPYVVAIIELAEGPRMMSNIVDVEPEDVRIGMPVEVTFEDITGDISLPKFHPIR